MILQLGKIRWLLGMHWDAFDTAPSIGEIKREAQSMGANMYALRISDLAVQAGYFSDMGEASTKRGSRLYSLAARLAGAVAEPWFGVFDLGDNQYWYIAVRDGYSILPDGDVVGSFDEVEAARQGHAGFNDWKKEEGNLETLESLLGEISRQEAASGLKKVKLVPVEYFGQRTAAYTKFGAIAVGTCVVIGGALFWHYENQKKQEQIALAQDRARTVAQEQAKALAPLSTPLPNAWLSACKEVLFATQIVQFGWQLASVSCGVSSATLEWKLAPGATVKNRPDGALSPDGALVTQTIALDGKALVNTVPNTPPGDLSKNLESLRFIAQGAGMNLELVATEAQPGQGASLPGQLSNTAGNAVAAANSALGNQSPKLKNQAFRLTNKSSPFGIDFDTVESLRLSKITSSLSADKGWEIEGVVYGF